MLREHCAQDGRDFAAIEKTVTSNVDFGEDPKAGAAALLAHLRELAAAGIDHALVSPRQGLGRGHLRRGRGDPARRTRHRTGAGLTGTIVR